MRTPVAALLAAVICIFSNAQATLPLDNKESVTTRLPITGEFVAMDPIREYEPGKSWFHESRMVVRSNEVILDLVPVVYYNSKREESASDGGFITYRGKLFEKDGQTFLSLRPFLTDYILFPIYEGMCEPYSKVKILPVAFVASGIDIEGLHYAPKKFNKQVLQRLETLLRTEPFEYTGKHPYVRDKKVPNCQ